MNENPPKKPPATVASEPHELEREIRLRAQELYEERGREDGHDWTTGSAPKRRCRRRQALSPADYAHIQKLILAPGLRGPFSCKPRPCHHFNRRFEFGGVVLAGEV